MPGPWIRGTVAALAAGAVTIGFVALRPDLVMVEHVLFQGNHRAGPGALRHLSDIRNGTNLWTVDLDRAARGVEGHPWVSSARALRRWPDTVVIEVEEHEPVALLHFDGQMYYVDAEGHPFLGGVTDELDYPSITGIGPGLERAHPDLPRLAVRDALWLLSELHNRALLIPADVSQIAFSPARGYTVYTRGSRLVFGLDDMPRQLARLSILVRRGDVDLAGPHLVDLAPPTVAIVRPLHEASS